MIFLWGFVRSSIKLVFLYEIFFFLSFFYVSLHCWWYYSFYIITYVVVEYYYNVMEWIQCINDEIQLSKTNNIALLKFKMVLKISWIKFIENHPIYTSFMEARQKLAIAIAIPMRELISNNDLTTIPSVAPKSWSPRLYAGISVTISPSSSSAFLLNHHDLGCLYLRLTSNL